MKKALLVVIVVMAAVAGLMFFFFATLLTSTQQAQARFDCSTVPGILPGVIPQPYNSTFTETSAYYKIDPALLAAIFMSEHANNWPNPDGSWATSPKGANGPFQFIPPTWAAYGDSNPNNPNGDPQNLQDSAYAAAHYLSDLGAKPGMSPGDPDAPVKGTVAWVAGAYNGGSPNIGNPENDRYRKNAVERFLEFSGASFGGDPTATGVVADSSVYVLGDSIALGAKQDLTAALGSQYASAYINASQNRSILGAGVTPGYTTSGLEALKEDANKNIGGFRGVDEASTVIIELGTNDLRGGAAFESRIDELVAAVRNINSSASIYWVEIFSEGAVDKESLNASLNKRASVDGYQIIPTVGKGIELGSDGVHPTTEGNSKFGLLVAGISEQVPNDTCTQAPVVAGSAEDLARNPNITFTHPGPELEDLASGRISPKLVALLSQIASTHKISIFALATDHKPGTNHEAGRAADIWMVDGDNCYPPDKSGGCWQLAQELDGIQGCLHSTELIYYYDPGPSADSFAQSDHDDHIHVGYDGPLGPKHYNDGVDPCSEEAITGSP